MVRGVRSRLGMGLVAMAIGLSACSDVQLYGSAVPYKSSGYSDRPAAPDAPGTMVVQKGDTVYSIARAKGISVRELIDANGLTAPYALKAGQKLAIPTSRSYVVQKGDTLYAVARRFGVDTASLVKANDLKQPYAVVTGQRLTIPGGPAKTVASPAAPTTATVTSAVIPAPAPAAVAAETASVPEQPAVAAPDAAPQAVVAPPPPAEPVAAPPRSGRGFLWPVRGRVLAEYGPTGKGQHNDGLNIEAKAGAPIRAAEDGVVAYAGNELRGFGNLLLVKHGDGFVTAYAHCDDLMVKRGDKVRRGAVIAKVGQSGNVPSPQLHFEVRKGTQALDPRQYLPQAQASLPMAEGRLP